MIPVARKDWGCTPVLMDSWNNSMKTADSSLAVYLRARFDRPIYPEDEFSLRNFESPL